MQTYSKPTKTFLTSYKEAVNWLHNDYVLCNNIPNIDESIWDNMEFNYFNENDHWGTSWDYVSNVVNCFGDNYPRCKTFKELTGYEY